MPRKRKAQQALAAIAEEAEAPSNQKGDERSTSESQIEKLIEECKEQVKAKANSQIAFARQEVQHLRTDGEVALLKIPKQVRQMSAAGFFRLSPEEANATFLGDIIGRLELLQQEPNAVPQAAAQVLAVVASNAASAAAVEREPQAAQSDQQQHGQEADAAAAGPSAAAGPCSSAQAVAAVGLMPPPQPPPARQALAPVNPPARAPMQNEVVYSVNGSPIFLGAVQASAAPVTGAVKGAAFNLTDATPAVGASCVPAAAPPTMAFTGRTFRRATAARGRTKQATRAITVTTEDGKQFTVDDVIGLAAVPEKYRVEVRKLVEADYQDLDALMKSVAAIEVGTTSSAAATTSNARPTRRR
ncbi:hypothetical protein Agub_g12236 [Astrephomene gubernaculifera]|uniref:Borealin N-terminal domain-containing protein n=1 Tax=Astrephomene gubernaculifera TaxID=47775 RepID=A0AAD3HRC2_9CHLO|nr:hypothetical protein Agub_g12236 [Astrephomene gubernaculifera]